MIFSVAYKYTGYAKNSVKISKKYRKRTNDDKYCSLKDWDDWKETKHFYNKKHLQLEMKTTKDTYIKNMK